MGHLFSPSAPRSSPTQRKMERLSLVQQIAQLEDVAPLDFDPEDIQVTGIDLDTVADNSAARAHYVDVGPSSLRKLHESLSDPKYDGAKTSRKSMLDDDDESDAADELAESASQVSEAHPETYASDHDSGLSREVGTPTVGDASTKHPDTTQNDDLSSSLRKIREEDRKKGKAISRQIALWDSLLDARIRLQKSVAAGNRLPPLLKNAADQQLRTSLTKVLEEAELLSDELFNLQEHLLSVNEFVQLPPRKRRKATESGHSVAGYAETLHEACHAASRLECIYHPHLVQTLNKWSSKIQAVTPSNRNAFSRVAQHIKSAPQLIDETLADHDKVLARTRIFRGKGERLEALITDEDETRARENGEVFDDTDFYHQLLRDIIDTRGDGTGGSEDWIAVQKEKKAKKKVDTKASKGRKLRYEVHEKLQSFMVPVTTQGSWHEERIDELFASLLGRGFEDAMQELGEVVDAPSQELELQAEGGFRVFG